MTRRHRFFIVLGVLFSLLVLAGISAVLVLRSSWFAGKVRERIVAEVEKASGGRTEIAAFDFDWRTRQATVDGFVLHGTEALTEAPLLQVKRVVVGIGVSSVFRRDIHVRTIDVEEPQFHLIATADGKTNLPSPKVKQGDTDFVDTLLKLAANELTVHHGVMVLNEHRIPLELEARDVDVRLRFNTNRNKPVYYGDVSSKQLEVQAMGLGPMTFALNSSVLLEHGVIQVTKAKVSTKASHIDVSGYTYHLLDPASDFGVNATLALAEFGGPLHLPMEHKGTVQFVGKVSLNLKDRFSYAVEGRVRGRGLGVREERVLVQNATVDSLVLVNPQGVTLRRAKVDVLGGEFNGGVEWADFRKLTLDGVYKNFETSKVLSATSQKPLPYSAVASGPLHFEGELVAKRWTKAVLKTDITLESAGDTGGGGMPLDGLLNVTWTQAANTIELRESHLATATSSLDVSGTLGQHLEVTAKTTRPADIQPFLSEPLPIQLNNGAVSFQGSVSGPLENPMVEGHATLTKFVIEARALDSLVADFLLTRDRLEARSLNVVQGPIQVDGSGSVRLQDWKADDRSAFTARLNLRGARIETLLADVKQADIPVTGAVSIQANLHGSVAELAGEAQVLAENVTAWDEHVQRVKAQVKLTSDRVEIADGSALFQKSEIPFSISYTHKPAEWNNGSATFSLKTTALDVTQVHHLSERLPQWKGLLTAAVTGAGLVADKVFRLTALNGDASVRGLTYDGRLIGPVDVHAASTNQQELNLTASSTIRGGRLRASGMWKLDGAKYPGGGEIATTSISLQNLRELFQPGERAPLPFQSTIEAGAAFKVPLSDPRELTADVKIQRLFIAPGAQQRLGAGAKEQDLILENARPILVHVTPTGAVIEPASFHATNTSIEVGGKVGFESKQGWDLTLKGGLNMAELQMFRQDLLASGTASIDATIRGTLTDPQVNGSLTLSKASLYFGDMPAGLDNVNGVVSFDRNRATLQTMTADSGGGKMSLSGFVGFGGPALVYRMQGNATGVRVRYPEGASTTVNANLSLTGTSQQSLLAGTVSIVRAAFTPRSDLGSLLADLTKPGAPTIPQENDYIRGMQLDVRIESSPTLEFQTSLTRGLQAEVDLRLRGTAVRPTLLGDVTFSEGEISLFGNKYTLNRGDIRFFNPTRIEPVFDLEAETRARGIDVNVSFSGTASKMNVSYRSDPPLQPSDIIALLAIGRDPNVSAGIASSQVTQQGISAGLGNVVGEAVASSVTNRLQKFFGVTKIKIDPQLTGLDNIPQARLTLEQQVSKDITLTYITNISRTQETLVRIQYDLSREWSAIAVREENGLFGIDFQYKKRFK